MGKTNEKGYYRIESASYGTGTTFLAEPMKDFYMYRALKFVRERSRLRHPARLSVTPKATLELWVNSAGPDGTSACCPKPGPATTSGCCSNPTAWPTISGFTSTARNTTSAPRHGLPAPGVYHRQQRYQRHVTAYKNGVPLGSHTFAGVTGNWSDPPATGCWAPAQRRRRTDHFGGLIDEVAVYDTTLSVAAYSRPLPGPRDMTEEKGCASISTWTRATATA
jgi:hypothetical protein